jgi:hypothetical protein
MIIKRWIGVVFALTFFASVQANTVTGVVGVMQVHPPSNNDFVS